MAARRKRYIACDELFHCIAKLIARSLKLLLASKPDPLRWARSGRAALQAVSCIAGMGQIMAFLIPTGPPMSCGLPAGSHPLAEETEMRGGWATTVQWSGISRATTAPAPTFTPRPTRIPPTKTAPAPIQQFGPI